MADSQAGINPDELSNIAAAEKEHWWYRGMRLILAQILSRHVPVPASARVLEAGCGTGYNSDWLRKQYGWQMIPVDLESRALQYVRNLHLPNPVQADIAALPFQDASFDLVLSLDVLVHLPRGEENRCLAELSRVTKASGIVLLRVAALEPLRSRHSQYIDERQRFTRRRLVRTLTESGLRVLYCTYANSLLLPVAITIFRLWEPLMRKAPATGIATPPDWLNHLLYLPLALEARWLRSGLRFPLGQSLIAVAEKSTPKSEPVAAYS
jgi:SAM-dependent methyltransferase